MPSAVRSTSKGRGAACAPPSIRRRAPPTGSPTRLRAASLAAPSVITEWSNFLGGDYWWIQSLYILPEHRGQGLVDQLLAHLSAQAMAAGALDLRLYGYDTNERALRAYQRCGFGRTPYVVLTKPLRGR